MKEQKVRVHSENAKDFERGSQIMISTYLKMFWINNKAEDRKPLWVLQSLLQPTGVTVEQRNTKISIRHVRNRHLHIIHSYYSSMMSALCCMLTKQTHKCRYKYTHHMKNPLFLISVSAVCSPFCEWEVSVCGAGGTHTAHTHINTKAWVILSLPPCSQLAQFQSNTQNLYCDGLSHSDSAGFAHYV